MGDTGSITELLQHLRQGDRHATEGLWRCYFARMSARARRDLLGNGAVADEEDAAISAFDTFCRHLATGQYEKVGNRNDLWALLAAITRRKMTKARRRQHRHKRGGGARHQPIGPTGGSGSDTLGWSDVADFRGSPALGNGLDAHCEELLELLPDESLRHIAIRRLEGFTNDEIAAELNIALRSVERKLSRVRDLWRQELSP